MSCKELSCSLLKEGHTGYHQVSYAMNSMHGAGTMVNSGQCGRTKPFHRLEIVYSLPAAYSICIVINL